MYAAVDIGGTKTLLAVLNGKAKIVEQRKFPTPKKYEDFKIGLANIVANLSTKEFNRVVVAAPGLIDRKRGIVLNFGNLPWENTPIARDLEKIFHAPALLENDAKLAALSEAHLVKKDYRKVLYITISTGIGAGYIIDGKIDAALEDMEPGHMLLEHNDRLERWEHFASGKAVYEKFQKKFSEIDDSQIWYIIARNIAVGLINLIATLTPDVIIIGGGAGAYLDKFKDRLEEHLQIYENPMLRIPPLIEAKNPELAVIYGCYRLAEEYRHDKKTS